MKNFLCSLFVVLSCATTATPASHPLHAAAKKGNVAEIERLLTEKICGVNDWDYFGFAPLHRAARAGHLECLKALIARGANVVATTLAGNTPLHLAACWGRLACVEYLVNEVGVDIEVKNGRDKTSRDLAAEWGYEDVVDFFEKYQALPDIKEPYVENENGKS